MPKPSQFMFTSVLPVRSSRRARLRPIAMVRTTAIL